MTSTANRSIFFPEDELCKSRKTQLSYLLGYRHQQDYIIILLLSPIERDALKLPDGSNDPILGHIQVLGRIWGLKLDKGHHRDKQPANLELSFIKGLPYPIVEPQDDKMAHIFVIYRPPKYRSLEYLSLSPILLQSTPPRIQTETQIKIKQKFGQLQGVEDESSSQLFFDQPVLDLINQCYPVRKALLKWTGGRINDQIPKPLLLKVIQSRPFRPVLASITMLLHGTVWLNQMLSLVRQRVPYAKHSAVLRQLEIRLRQLNYLPIQLLCYCDRNILLQQEKLLDLPLSNSNLNINNSNYISFFNTVWLIINDVLIGTSVYRLITAHSSSIVKLINEDLLNELLFSKLFRLISWVSYNHPAGFKLNNELGSFVGELFLWSLNFWHSLMFDLFIITPNTNYGHMEPLNLLLVITGHISLHRLLPYLHWSTFLLLVFVKVVCYCGFSFVVSFAIDYFLIVTFHVSSFYNALAKIYQRQTSILKLLFQLVCGRKYNVLRNRIDKLDVYATKGESYEVEQLLLGTLLFVTMSLLLPTIFAFYLTFFACWSVCLLMIYTGENILVVTNFSPIFVMLLKLKNSDRLQGGLTFAWINTNNSTTYLKLGNKSLNYREIFSNFRELFRNSKDIFATLIPNFLNGEPLSLEQDKKQALKLDYLMLPRNYKATPSVWLGAVDS